MADNKKQPEKGPKPAMAPKRQNPVAVQMSRADSLRSMGEFGKVLSTEEQAKARTAMQNKQKPGPLHRLMNALSGR